ncbi:8-oxo-dGTP diphosphatase [Acholeplasma equirhinis]|uniref:NUDIX hydrolase n=1 Tax=Acholeplasma equirhinis TaxID=555393 RepID=UPI00197AE531|nr:8-oxo-dGTP diphosphatase [Acholeplasma equirhinis]MBN3490138.1 8-oxo-dGTP diphosphatase [Acholeplasma equirhinis]
MKKTVLIYIENENKYLLILKQKKDMNQNKYSGVGGKIEPGETAYEAAVRETKEETGLTIKPIFKGIVHFHQGAYEEHMTLFKAYEFEGKLQASDEGDLFWIDKNELKKLPMWEGDYYFIEKLENEDIFEMHLYYEGEKLIKIE